MGEQAHLMVDRGDSRPRGRRSKKRCGSSVDAVDQGQINYWLGYCEYKLGQPRDAERTCAWRANSSRSSTRSTPTRRLPARQDRPGRQAPGRGELVLRGVVLTSHPDSKVATDGAKLGRGVCRIMLAQDDPGLTDLHDVTNYVNGREQVKRKYKVEALTGMKAAAQTLTDRGQLPGRARSDGVRAGAGGGPAQQSEAGLPPSFYARLGSVYERRAEQVERNLPDSIAPAEKIKREQQVRDFRAKAGDAYIAYSAR
jgi:hypothetical protein